MNVARSVFELHVWFIVNIANNKRQAKQESDSIGFDSCYILLDISVLCRLLLGQRFDLIGLGAFLRYFEYIIVSQLSKENMLFFKFVLVWVSGWQNAWGTQQSQG